MKNSLCLVGNLWTMSEYPNPLREWSLERKINAIADAGFHAVTGDLDEKVISCARKLDLDYVGWFWPKNCADVRAGAEACQRLGLQRATVFLGHHNTSHAQVLAMALELHRQGLKRGIYFAPETHRDTGTETPEKTSALLKAFQIRTGQELPITWDFSHHAVVKHLLPQQWPERLLIHKINIQQAELFHFRPFNGHHAQIPVRVAGRKTSEYNDFLNFTKKVFTLWRSAPANQERTFLACPEVGPKVGGYGLSYEMPSWEQATLLAKDLKKIWSASAS
ncbi:MAG: hypothetical protein SH807_03355 [Blastochloris sp.]|nr:hypothetical protein [Blastochloris sp.]